MNCVFINDETTPDHLVCINCGRRHPVPKKLPLYAMCHPGGIAGGRPPADPEFLARSKAEIAEAETQYDERIKPTMPNLAERAGHYVQALLKWRAAGYLVRTDEEVAAIVAVCEACPKWNSGKQSCGICGCGVNSSPSAWKSKARMGSEVCPIGKWR